jgi:integrase
MPERIRLNKTTIEELPIPAKGRKYYYDLDVRNLALCITDRGARTWYRCGRVHGRPQRYRIGTFETLTPQQARDECKRLNGEVASRQDPMAARRKKRAEMTIQELFDWVLKHHSKPTKKTWERDQAEYDQKLKHWAGRRISTLTAAEIREHHTKLSETKGKYAANKMRELLRLMFSIAVKNDWMDYNPVSAVPRAKTQSRERFLSADELARWFRAVSELQRETTRDFLLMALFTGARRSNVCAMRWSEIDFERRVWTIPGIHFKNGEPMPVVLVDQALAILERRKDESQSQWVFPGGGRTGHLVEPKAAWQRVAKEAGLKDVRLHDLRRTFGSWMAAGGSSLQIVGKALGHKSQAATQIYSRLALDPVREAVSAAVNAIESASKKNL